MPGLAFSLGVPHVDTGLPDDVVEEDAVNGRRFCLADGRSGTEVVEQHATRTTEGVYFLQLGKARGPRWENTRQHFGFQRVLDDLPGAGWSIVGDLPGGTRQPFMTWGRWADTYLVVVEPTPASWLSGRRLARLAAMAGAPQVVALANKVRASGDAERIHERTGLEVVGEVPLDPAQAQADRQGVALLDHNPDAPAVAALRCLVDSLHSERNS